MTGYSLNAAIGLQVVISALITGLSAVTTGRHVRPPPLSFPSFPFPSNTPLFFPLPPKYRQQS